MQKKIKDIAKELKVDKQKIVDFVRVQFNKPGAYKNTLLNDFEYDTVKAKFVPASPSLSSSRTVSSSEPVKTMASKAETNEEVIKEQSNTEVKSTVPTPSIMLSDDLEQRATNLTHDVNGTVAKEGTAPKELNRTEKDMLSKAEKPSGFKKYLEYLESVNKNLNGLLDKRNEREKAIIDKQNQLLEEIKNEKNEQSAKSLEFEQKIKEFEEEKTKFESERKTIQPRLDAVNMREQDLVQREINIANKEYSEIILSLTKSMKKSQEDIQRGSEEWINSLVSVVKEYQEHVKGLASQRLNLEKKEATLADKEEEVSAREEMLSMQAEAMQEDVTEDMEHKYGQEIEELNRKNQVYEHKFERLNEQIRDYKQKLDAVSSQFGGSDVTLITSEFKHYKDEVNHLKSLLDAKVDRSEYDDVVAERDEVTRINTDLKGKLRDERLSAVRQLAQDTDELKSKYKKAVIDLETAKASVNTLTIANESLSSTIAKLTEDSKDPTKAFEYVNKIKDDKELNKEFTAFKEPSSLHELATYVRRRMALGDGNGHDQFFYDDSTIKTFIAGLNMSPISILEGISGTGKTSLPVEFIKAITAGSDVFEDRNNKAAYRLCAIQSGWRDNMDLMGYFNSFDCKYNETDFFKALYVAGLPKYADTLFFIVMDEMNLSHPEHYFADFLSLLERKNVKNRVITVKAPNHVLPDRIKEGMSIPKNVRFIGTANNDETTNSFAPKTYDRSNVIEMPRNKDMGVTPTTETYSVSYHWFENRFEEAEKKYESYYDTFHEFIEDKGLIDLLGKKDIGIGNRFADLQAKKFICVYMACGDNPDADLAEAVDHLMTSRLLRVLGNKYGLSSNKINVFKNDYVGIFKLYFNDKVPNKAIQFLDALAGSNKEEDAEE